MTKYITLIGMLFLTAPAFAQYGWEDRSGLDTGRNTPPGYSGYTPYRPGYSGHYPPARDSHPGYESIPADSSYDRPTFGSPQPRVYGREPTLGDPRPYRKTNPRTCTSLLCD